MRNETRITPADVGLLLIRVMVGFVMFYHGAQKLFGWFGGGGFGKFQGFIASMGMPLPALNAALAVAAEFGGGLLLMLGLGTRFVALPAAFTMAVAVWVHREGGFSAGDGGFEYPLTLGVVLIGLALTGGGKLGVSRLLPGKARTLLA